MSVSAFGVDHGSNISKMSRKKKAALTTGVGVGTYVAARKYPAATKAVKSVISTNVVRPVKREGKKMLVRALQESVEKSDDTKRGLATAGGALAGSAAYNTGYAGKWIGYHQRGKHKYTKAEGEQLNAHNKQYKGNKPGFFRNYPKNLPSAKLQRTLGRTHSGKSGMALHLATIGAGGLAGYEISKKDVSHARAMLQQQLDSRPNMSEANRMKLQRQISALDDISSGKKEAPPAAQKPAPKPKVVTPPPLPKKTVGQQFVENVKSSPKLLKNKGFLVPAGGIVATGLAGYGASKLKT